MTSDSTAAADGFVLAMLAMMFLSGAVVALLIFCGLRNAARRDHHVDELIDEVSGKSEPPKPAPAGNEAPKAEPWEKDGDWWKK
jgi:hypothetical protein